MPSLVLAAVQVLSSHADCQWTKIIFSFAVVHCVKAQDVPPPLRFFFLLRFLDVEVDDDSALPSTCGSCV